MVLMLVWGGVISNRVVQSHAQGLRLFLTTFG
jgi:hypothetical protein